ncbi:glycosyltransferase family 4 protein [Sulfurospirillum barnesii]|nr:glycosyltransferase family 4 protein [Sulfurospirillum barnesii]
MAFERGEKEMSKTVLHVNFAKGFRGGERQTLLLLQELSHKGYTQTLLTRRHAELAKKVSALALENVVIIEVKKPYLLSLSLLKKADLVHAHETKAAQFAFLGHLFFKTPYIITRRVDNAIKNNGFTRAMYRYAHKTVVLSRAILEEVKKIEPRANLSIIPSAFSKLSVSPHEVEKIKERFSGQFVIGNIGELDNDHKGQYYLIEAMKELLPRYANMHLLFLGKGKDEEAYKAQASSLKNVTFEGFVSNVGDYIATFDLFVFPSLREGLGSILLDVMQAKVPIVASNAGGIPDVICHEKNGLLVAPKDVSALAEAIERLYLDKTLREQLIESAFQDVDLFSPEKMAERYAALYAEVLG